MVSKTKIVTLSFKKNPLLNEKGNPLKVKIRKDTTDEKVIQEVLQRKDYIKKKINFDILPGETWLDAGANIGTFSLLALSKGAKVRSYEPEKNNFSLLKQNIKLNKFKDSRFKLFQKGLSTKTGKVKLYISKGDYNKYRHTTYKKRGRPTVDIKVQNFNTALTKSVTGVKMDIEGSEVPILESVNDWKNVQKLVFEYTFDVFPSMKRYKEIIKKLKKNFTVYEETKVKKFKGKEYRFYPPQTIVFCVRK